MVRQIIAWLTGMVVLFAVPAVVVPGNTDETGSSAGLVPSVEVISAHTSKNGANSAQPFWLHHEERIRRPGPLKARRAHILDMAVLSSLVLGRRPANAEDKHLTQAAVHFFCRELEPLKVIVIEYGLFAYVEVGMLASSAVRRGTCELHALPQTVILLEEVTVQPDVRYFQVRPQIWRAEFDGKAGWVAVRSERQ